METVTLVAIQVIITVVIVAYMFYAAETNKLDWFGVMFLPIFIVCMWVLTPITYHIIQGWC